MNRTQLEQLKRAAVASRDAGEMRLAFDRKATVGQHQAWWGFLTLAKEDAVIEMCDLLLEVHSA